MLNGSLRSTDDNLDGRNCVDRARLVDCVTAEFNADDMDGFVVAADGGAVNSHEVIGGKPSPGRRDSSLRPE